MNFPKNYPVILTRNGKRRPGDNARPVHVPRKLKASPFFGYNRRMSAASMIKPPSYFKGYVSYIAAWNKAKKRRVKWPTQAFEN